MNPGANQDDKEKPEGVQSLRWGSTLEGFSFLKGGD